MPDAKAVYGRVRDKGRLMPDGVSVAQIRSAPAAMANPAGLVYSLPPDLPVRTLAANNP